MNRLPTLDEWIEIAHQYYSAFDKRMFEEKSIPFMRGYDHGKKCIYKNPYKTNGFAELYNRGFSFAENEK
jgi:hypothetical protein